MLLSDNGYRYRDGAPLEEYFYNTGKTFGAIHRLSRQYRPIHRRPEFFDIYCWYMFDLAHIWTHGVGWYRHIADPRKRMEGMQHYFDTVLEGYRSETQVPDSLLAKLPLFIDMTVIENVVDEFECSAREGELPDSEDIGDLAECLIHDITYVGFGEG